MAKFKSITSARVVVAGRKRSCGHDKKHSVSKGEQCLEVPTGTMGWKGYCAACGIAMVDRGLVHLGELRRKLSEPHPAE